MESRYADRVGDRFQRQIAAQVTLDEPEGFGGDAHGGPIMTRPPWRCLTVVAVSSRHASSARALSYKPATGGREIA